jgi:steroid 5-alpha reductase family enzyme
VLKSDIYHISIINLLSTTLLSDRITQFPDIIMYSNWHFLRSNTLPVCTIVYSIALAIAIATGFFLRSQHPVMIAGIADIAATIIVFAASMIFNNSSIYDPYWSIAPLPIAFFWAFNAVPYNANMFRQIAVLVLLTVWAIRLTYNCMQRWKNIKHEDWRYADIRRNTGSFYWPVSFLGFHLFPTIIVFLGCLSLFPALSSGTNHFGILDIIAILVTGSAIFIEATADRELKIFISKRGNSEETINRGLWAYSRHPNYFGEVLFWWGLYLFALSANPAYWYLIIGPVAITLMFVFVSVPMMDKHMLSKRQSYIRNMETVPALIPWFPRRRISSAS